MDAGKRNEITMETLWRKAEKDGGLDRLRDHGALAASLRHFSDVNTDPRRRFSAARRAAPPPWPRKHHRNG